MPAHNPLPHDVQPGDHVVDGDNEYEVHSVEQNQGRLIITDTGGHTHPYPASSASSPDRR